MIDCIIEDDRWRMIGIEALAAQAFTVTISRLNHQDLDAQASLLATNAVQIAALNRSFRDKDSATNVLSWPSQERGATLPGHAPQPPQTDAFGECDLGDIALAWEVCEAEAAQAGKPMQAHCLHLIVHGVLHLLGYDHECDEDAALMEAMEIEILANLGVDNPY